MDKVWLSREGEPKVGYHGSNHIYPLLLSYLRATLAEWEGRNI